MIYHCIAAYPPLSRSLHGVLDSCCRRYHFRHVNSVMSRGMSYLYPYILLSLEKDSGVRDILSLLWYWLVYFWGKYPASTHRLGQIQQRESTCWYRCFFHWSKLKAAKINSNFFRKNKNFYSKGCPILSHSGHAYNRGVRCRLTIPLVYTNINNRKQRYRRLLPLFSIAWRWKEAFPQRKMRLAAIPQMLSSGQRSFWKIYKRCSKSQQHAAKKVRHIFRWWGGSNYPTVGRKAASIYFYTQFMTSCQNEKPRS